MVKIIAISGSTRGASLNTALLQRAVGHVREFGDASVEVVGPLEGVLPLYDQDLQDAEGIPAAAVALAQRITASDGLLIASPEYNGGYSALLKNTIDWLSRVDRGIFAHLYIGVLTASPGQGGGRRGATHLEQLFQGMRLRVHSPSFSLPGAHQVLAADRVEGLDEWVTAYVAQVDAHRGQLSYATS